jgi:hypothetical protein
MSPITLVRQKFTSDPSASKYLDLFRISCIYFIINNREEEDKIAHLPLSRDSSHMRQYAHYGFFTFIVLILFSSTDETVSLLQRVRHQVLLYTLQYTAFLRT